MTNQQLESHPRRFRQFASDNYAGVCPEAWEAMAHANQGHEPSYGEDRWTALVSDRLRELFETDCEVFFVFNGTSANSLALATLCQPYHSILCHELAHVETSECGAPEFFANGSKILLLPGPHGKVLPEAVQWAVSRRADIHYPKPRALSLTQVTELGTAYSVRELEQLCETARRHGLRIHMDGARFANAVAHLGVRPADITWKLGVDVLCFGGTKNGLAVGEAVVFFDRRVAQEFDYRCKQGGQLASKMRFLSAPWLGLLKNDTWLRNARHSNAMAQRLAEGLKSLPGVAICHPVESNAVFVRFPDGVAEQMHQMGWHFYTGVVSPGESRLMCSWDTTPEDVDAFLADLANVLNRREPSARTSAATATVEVRVHRPPSSQTGPLK
ncbi:MAG: low specificity L-threonine aldolase [Verrucomicrobiota bacterium]|nr:low specificity L-threonine aldolase [Limisphaera sp.]MDW8382164.1 low specificity L-threonine aldolase [Verrucomicrobiota bacterium]